MLFIHTCTIQLGVHTYGSRLAVPYTHPRTYGDAYRELIVAKGKHV